MSYKRSKYFFTPRNRKINYLLINKKSQITVVFFHGFMSDMIGKKPIAIENFCKKQKNQSKMHLKRKPFRPFNSAFLRTMGAPPPRPPAEIGTIEFKQQLHLSSARKTTQLHLIWNQLLLIKRVGFFEI